ncbi:hypothetical protein [Marinactinospora rubrisoli]|uniref:Uncharacterized protein n=1 Tax=Marinactinospora rubrisoli TaxID=2715399 RepID=A0ABW2KCH6_9ACTN
MSNEFCGDTSPACGGPRSVELLYAFRSGNQGWNVAMAHGVRMAERMQGCRIITLRPDLYVRLPEKFTVNPCPAAVGETVVINRMETSCRAAWASWDQCPGSVDIRHAFL